MMLEIVDLTAGPASPPILNKLDLSVAEGGRTAVLGPSGVGKTTLLRAISGLLTPEGGTIRIDGKTVHGPGVDIAPARRRVSLVFQSFALWPHLNAAEHIRLVNPGGEGPDWLDRLSLGNKGARLPGQLSGGEQARLSLARALSSQPRLLLMDEPFRNLDPVLARELRAELLGWFEQTGQSVVLVTHDPQEAEYLTDRWCVLGSEGIAAHNTPDALRANPGSASIAGLFGRVDLLPAEWTAPGRMRTVLGEVEATGEPDADSVLVRPEDLHADPSPGANGVQLEARFRENGRHLLRVTCEGHVLHATVDASSLATEFHLRVTRPLRAVRRESPLHKSTEEPSS